MQIFIILGTNTIKSLKAVAPPQVSIRVLPLVPSCMPGGRHQPRFALCLQNFYIAFVSCDRPAAYHTTAYITALF